jgi:hypothetical protein
LLSSTEPLRESMVPFPSSKLMLNPWEYEFWQ